MRAESFPKTLSPNRARTVKFFFPDSQDLVDPSFDFDTERRDPNRLRHRDDQYAHEAISVPVYDGMLVSKAIVEGVGSGAGGKYTLAQRHRLLRVGVREFFRLKRPIPVMGDCGAFSYVREEVPPFSVDDVLSFYDSCQFDLGISVDHVILDYNESWDREPSKVPEAVSRRREITLELAQEFRKKHTRRKLRFTPVGVAQGWSPKSYRDSVAALQKMGYKYIALGGMVPLKTADILRTLTEVGSVRKPDTRLHLLGVTRTDNVLAFHGHGVASFDSTSPLRQAFKDDKDNYYTPERNYVAVRIPQTEGNPSLQRRIRAGVVDHDLARSLEKNCLDSVKRYSQRKTNLESVIEQLGKYQHEFDPSSDYLEEYRTILTARPWENCACDICRSLGHHVVLFRGAERNRRRGFHNLFVFYRKLQQQLAAKEEPPYAKVA